MQLGGDGIALTVNANVTQVQRVTLPAGLYFSSLTEGHKIIVKLLLQITSFEWSLDRIVHSRSFTVEYRVRIPMGSRIFIRN